MLARPAKIDSGRISPGGPRRTRSSAYLRRLLTLWVAEDSDPAYSWLDCCDGLDRLDDDCRERDASRGSGSSRDHNGTELCGDVTRTRTHTFPGAD